MKKTCEICGCDRTDPLFSMSKYWCFECKKFYPFKLKPGQKSILIRGLVGSDEDSDYNTIEQQKRDKWIYKVI